MDTYVGEKFGKLIILSETEPNKLKYGKYSGRRFMAKCECGKIKSVNKRAVIRGRVKSCGCLQKEHATRHGLSMEKIYGVYRGMLQRCYDKKHWLYPRYGGRGITVCNEWKQDIHAFVKWAIENGYKKGLTIERKNNDLGYSSENCTFVSLRQNLNNTSKTIFLHVCGQKISLQNASRKYEIRSDVLYQRIKKLKWPDDKAVFTKVRKMKRRG
jgi:hypothetical protein